MPSWYLVWQQMCRIFVVVCVWLLTVMTRGQHLVSDLFGSSFSIIQWLSDLSQRSGRGKVCEAFVWRLWRLYKGNARRQRWTDKQQNQCEVSCEKTWNTSSFKSFLLGFLVRWKEHRINKFRQNTRSESELQPF